MPERAGPIGQQIAVKRANFVRGLILNSAFEIGEIEDRYAEQDGASRNARSPTKCRWLPPQHGDIFLAIPTRLPFVCQLASEIPNDNPRCRIQAKGYLGARIQLTLRPTMSATFNS